MNSNFVPDWDKIEKFIGFGRVDAPVVFVGIEEGLSSEDDLTEDLRVRSAYPSQVMDLKAAHDGIAGGDKFFDPVNGSLQSTWRVMADLMLKRDGRIAVDTEERRQYQALHLGRTDGETLLCELLPYPSPGADDWLYGECSRFRTREAYTKALLPDRIRLLRAAIHSRPRELVVCYGKRHWGDFDGLFPGCTWTTNERFRIGQVPGTRIVMTHHFSRNFMSDAELDSLARNVLR